MTKVYVLSSHPDAEVSDTINKMPADKLRVVLYGIARGYDFDESMDVAIFDGTKTTWLSSLEAAEQPLAPDGGYVCPECGVRSAVVHFENCSFANPTTGKA